MLDPSDIYINRHPFFEVLFTDQAIFELGVQVSQEVPRGVNESVEGVNLALSCQFIALWTLFVLRKVGKVAQRPTTFEYSCIITYLR